MFKNHSLDIKTSYQIGLILIGLLSAVVIVLNLLNLIKVFKTPPPEPTLNFRQQQLQSAFNTLNRPAKD